MTSDEREKVQALVEAAEKFSSATFDEGWQTSRIADLGHALDSAVTQAEALLSQPEEPRTKGVKWEVETRMDSHRVHGGIYATLPGVESPPGSYPLLIARCQDARDAELIVRAMAASQPEEEPGRPTWHCACCEGLTKRAGCPGLPAPEVVRSVAFEEAARTVEDFGDAAACDVAAEIRALAEAKRGSGGGHV